MYILTRSGRRFYFANPAPEAVDIEDIAHALSHINRFTGHAAFASSVAQHSIAVSNYLAKQGASPIVVLGGLLHDAHESYFNDISSPQKYFLGISKKEKRIQDFVLRTLGVPPEVAQHPAIKLADLTSLAVERELLMPPDGDEKGWECLNVVTPEMKSQMAAPVEGISPADVRDAFLQSYHSRLRACQLDGSMP